MRAMPIIRATLAVWLCAGCATHKPVPDAGARASVIAYAHEYPACAQYHSASRQRLVLQTFHQALNGDHKALARVFADYDTFGSGDCEAWCSVPWDILQALGDDRFAAFIRSQPASVRSAAFRWLVGPFGGTEAELRSGYPKTAELYDADQPNIA